MGLLVDLATSTQLSMMYIAPVGMCPMDEDMSYGGVALVSWLACT